MKYPEKLVLIYFNIEVLELNEVIELIYAWGDSFNQNKNGQTESFFDFVHFGVHERNRIFTPLRMADFESAASTYSATWATSSAVIIDDEPDCVKLLALQLKMYCPQVQVMAECTYSEPAC